MTRLLAAVALATVTFSASLFGHSGLRFSSPLDGSTLGASPSLVQLTFAERPEVALSTIRVLDAGGAEYQVDAPETVAGDPLSLLIRVRPLPRGVYTVHWRVVSAVDGHTSAGGFVFGVLMTPAAPAASTGNDDIPPLESAARAVFLIGVLLAIGVVTAAALRFGTTPAWGLAWLAWAVMASGVVLLAVALGRGANVGLAQLAQTSVGRAVVERAVGAAVMIVGLGIGALARRRARTHTAAIAIYALGAAGTVAAHVAAGHSAGGRAWMPGAITMQSAHIVLAGAWLGGLVVLAAYLRTSVPPLGAIRRFSTVAAIALAIVVVSGAARAYQEIDDWSGLLASRYGSIVLAKIVLLLLLAALGAINRWRNVPAAHADTRPLYRTALAEIVVATMAAIAAGMLAALPPPVSAHALAGLSVQAADFATTIRANFSAVSDQSGPNRFVVTVEDYDTGRAIDASNVTLRFTPIDDPGIAPTTLELSRSSEGAYAGTGAHVAFPGRWQVEMVVQHARTSVTIPIEIEAKGLPQFTSVLRPPNEPTTYTIEANPDASVVIRVDPEKAGANQLQISFTNILFEPLPVTNVVVTAQHERESFVRLPTEYRERHSIHTTVMLRAGVTRLIVTARNESGARIRTVLDLKIDE